METILDRLTAVQEDQVLTTYALIDWLEGREIPPPVSESFLSVWVSLLRDALLQRQGATGRYFRHGAGPEELRIHLSTHLAPEGWSDEELLAQLTLEVGLPRVQLVLLCRMVGDVFRELGGERAFEPVGWLRPKGTQGEHGFWVLFWSDFLAPKIIAPLETITGLELSAEELLRHRREGATYPLEDYEARLRPLETRDLELGTRDLDRLDRDKV